MSQTLNRTLCDIERQLGTLDYEQARKELPSLFNAMNSPAMGAGSPDFGTALTLNHIFRRAYDGDVYSTKRNWRIENSANNVYPFIEGFGLSHWYKGYAQFSIRLAYNEAGKETYVVDTGIQYSPDQHGIKSRVVLLPWKTNDPAIEAMQVIHLLDKVFKPDA
jgi:hypothetical protein